MTDKLLDILRSLPRRTMKFQAGQTVFRLGYPVRSIHIVCEGCIHLARYQADGSALIMQRADEGAVLAEASLYSSRYHCDAMAQVDSVTWALPRSDLIHSLQTNVALSQAWLQHLAREVQLARLHAEILSLKTVAARLDAWIAYYGELPEKGLWATTAHQMGVSPEALYRELSKRRLS